LISLHICYISQEYPPETGWGGIGSYTYEMAHALANSGHRVTVISRALNGESVTNENGVEVHRVAPSPSWDSIPVFWRLNKIWPGFAWAAMLKVRRIHRRQPIDIAEAAECRADGFFVSYLPSRPKLVTRLHTARIFIDRFNGVNGKQSGHRVYWLEKQSICRANLVTAPSKAVIDLTRTWLPLSEQTTLVVHNPIDQANFSASTSVRKDTVLYAARLERNKGAETIQEAIPILLRQFPSLEFRIVGTDGIDRDGQSWRQKITASLDGSQRTKVRFEEMSRTELVQAYQEAAVCILPSTWENSSYVLLEAMACATPVVACNSGGSPELIENGVSGFLIPVNDSQALVSRVAELLSEPSLRKAMGDNARRRIEESFSVERVLPKMIAAYDYAIAQG
jgi:glycosyltransferase involved in cell wall biosynthesis